VYTIYRCTAPAPCLQCIEAAFLIFCECIINVSVCSIIYVCRFSHSRQTAVFFSRARKNKRKRNTNNGRRRINIVRRWDNNCIPIRFDDMILYYRSHHLPPPSHRGHRVLRFRIRGRPDDNYIGLIPYNDVVDRTIQWRDKVPRRHHVILRAIRVQGEKVPSSFQRNRKTRIRIVFRMQ